MKHRKSCAIALAAALPVAMADQLKMAMSADGTIFSTGMPITDELGFQENGTAFSLE